ncbi:MAG: hypothetical protein ACF8PN_16200 [Phycisphaerales bacterium]
MKPIKYLLGGLTGGLVGAAIWAAVSHYFHYEIGWIAWLVGALAGIGVRAVAGDDPPRLSAGFAGAFAAVLCIAAGKYAAGVLDTHDYLNDDDLSISYIADDIILEYVEAGRPLPPIGGEESEALDAEWTIAQDYPETIWNEAMRRWDALTVEVQDQAKTAPGIISRTYMVAFLADFIVTEREQRGETIDWPDPIEEYELAFVTHGYPPEIWYEALTRWNDASTTEQGELRALVKQRDLGSSARYFTWVSVLAFLFSIGPWDVLWIILAVGTGFKVGYGGDEEESTATESSIAAPVESGDESSVGPKGFYFGPGSAGEANDATDRDAA